MHELRVNSGSEADATVAATYQILKQKWTVSA